MGVEIYGTVNTVFKQSVKALNRHWSNFSKMKKMWFRKSRKRFIDIITIKVLLSKMCTSIYPTAICEHSIQTLWKIIVRVKYRKN